MKEISKLLHFIFSFICVSALFSCTADESITEPTACITIKVETEAFTPLDGTVTRASEKLYKTEFAGGDQIGITAMKDGKIVDGVKNICFTYNATTKKWEAAAGSPSLYYYPDVTYLAYYPYDAAMNDKMTEQEIIDAFTPQTDQSTYANYTKSDLMTGTGTVSVTNGKPTLAFQLAHRMSLLVIYPRGQHYQTLDGYDFYAPPKDITTLKVGAMTALYQPGDCTFRAIIAPSTVDVTINYITTEDVALEYTGSVTTTSGKYSKMSLTLASLPLSYTISVGDYFFADGGLLPATTPLAEVNKKNCIGLVFHPGKHSTDSGTYTDKSGAPMDVHGYVLGAAPNLYKCSWGSRYTDVDKVGTSTNENDYMGYYNTNKIKERALSRHPDLVATSGLSTDPDNNYPATYYVTFTFENDCPSPQWSSGWFLPSMGQLIDLRDNTSKLKENLIKLGRDISIYDEAHYSWSSTESFDYDSQICMGYNLYSAVANPAGKEAYYAVIAVLAF